MEVHQLRYFCAVARMRSFTRAAEEEGIAQPSLSQQILKLETEMGAPLFERLGRSVRLTQCGELLLPQAQAILRQVTGARQSVQGLLGGVKGRLVVGSIPTIMPYFVARHVPPFLKQYPEVDLQLVEHTTSRLIDALQAGDVDLAVASLPLSNRDLVCSELFRERIVLALPPDHPLAKLEEVELAKIRNEPLLFLREGHCFRESALAACRKARIAGNPIFESDQFASIFALVAGGSGISLLPEMAAAAADGCRIVRLRPEIYRRIGYAYVRRQFRPPAQKAFVQELKSPLYSLRPGLFRPAAGGASR
jgi:LysR family transcriptional regulator, hydrogen peroxide-inducible genes activator